MEPSWVRPTYLYLLSLVGIVAMAIGAVVFLLGIVHAISPELQRQGDPVFRAASAILDVAEVVIAESEEEPLPSGVADALDEARAELDSQARHAGVNQLITGLIVFLVGAAIFGFHWRRADQGSRPPQQQPPPPREGVLGP